MRALLVVGDDANDQNLLQKRGALLICVNSGADRPQSVKALFYRAIIAPLMPLAPGTHLGPYEITTPLGAGGMGEVYRARDTRLERSVAIKILPEQLCKDPARKQRFEREAKTISSLNHPHICTLYDVGSQDGIEYLVMECVEGETLAKRFEKGALPLEQVLKYGAQIGDALDKAHRAGIVHRDLKPGNIMLTPSGAKLLDFGLAKAVVPTSLATITATKAESPVTREGTIVGTVQYMSPEQVEGKELDGRSDIFSLGAVLYEMITGKRAFEGKSQLSVASAILEKEPVPISGLKPLAPRALEHTISRCLAKDPDDRWQTARDLAWELKWITEAAGKLEDARPERRTARSWLPWGLTIILLGIVALMSTVLRPHLRQPNTSLTRFDLLLKTTDTWFMISPDGRQLAFMAPGPNKRQLIWIRALDSVEPRPLPGTENVFGPSVTWSPDSRFIAFQAGSKLKKINVSGGPPQPICDVPYTILGGAWNRDDTLLFGTVASGLISVPGQGGTPRFVTSASGRNEVHVFPFFLRDGQRFAYLRAPEDPGIYVGSLDSKSDQQNAKRIIATPVMAGYVPELNASGGHLLFMREGSLMAQTFNENRLELTGEPTPIADNVSTYLLSASFSASSGVLVYRAGRTGLGLSTLAWFDRKGRELGNAGEESSNVYLDVAISPNASRVAVSKADATVAGSSHAIWLLDLARRVSARFTFDVAPDTAPVWSPDGSHIAYSGSRVGGMGIYQRAANGTSTEQTLISPVGEPMYPNHWSADGRFLLYTKESAKTKSDLWVLPVGKDGRPAGESIPIAATEYSETQGMFSPNSRWIAYASDESGREEVYLRSFPASQGDGTKLQISRDGGRQPHWRGDGKELFYLSLDRKIMVVDVSDAGGIGLGAPTPLFELPGTVEQSDFLSWPWDVTTDGKRFLMGKTKKSSEPVTVTLNWSAELKNK
jgi:eukaryotic-like serine/threonine-protein kinase